MPALFAWLLSLALRHWHEAADALLALIVCAKWYFLGPTFCEVLLVASLVCHELGALVKGLVDGLLSRWFPVGEDD